MTATTIPALRAATGAAGAAVAAISNEWIAERQAKLIGDAAAER